MNQDSDTPYCPCCTSGNHSIGCTCGGTVHCCHPDTHAATAEPTLSVIKRWTFDTPYQAAVVADRLNSGERVGADMEPVRMSLQAGWGLTRNGKGVWRVRGLGI